MFDLIVDELVRKCAVEIVWNCGVRNAKVCCLKTRIVRPLWQTTNQYLHLCVPFQPSQFFWRWNWRKHESKFLKFRQKSRDLCHMAFTTARLCHFPQACLFNPWTQMTTLPLSTYLLWLICISGAFSLSTSPLRSQNLRKDIPTASMGSTGYTVCTVTSMRDCTEVSDSHAGTNKGWQSLLSYLSCGFSKGLKANKLLPRFEKRSGICFFATQMGYNRLQPNQTKHESSQESPSRQTWRNSLVRMGASALPWMLWEMLTNIFLFAMFFVCSRFVHLHLHGTEIRREIFQRNVKSFVWFSSLQCYALQFCEHNSYLTIWVATKIW